MSDKPELIDESVDILSGEPVPRRPVNYVPDGIPVPIRPVSPGNIKGHEIKNKK